MASPVPVPSPKAASQALTAELRDALLHDQLVLHYQPLVDLSTGTPVGYEALVRWAHPRRGLLSPRQFLFAAEQDGLIDDLGAWVLREACRQIVAWQPAWGDRRYVSVNVAASQIAAGILLPQVDAALATSGLDPLQLQLEVTESSIMTDFSEAERLMREVHQLGVRWALDDFGTGYSCLSYLRRFPVQVLKIDKSFVDDITDDDTGGPLVDGIIAMARNLRMSVVAEGIENAEQGMRVRGMGGDLGQGFFYAKPLPPEAVLAYHGLIAP